MSAFAASLVPGEVLIVPGVIDPFTARLVESLQFPAVYLGGHAMGSHLAIGQPRLNITDTVAIATNVARSVQIPVVVDGGAGFGGTIHIERLVRDLHAAGVAAVHIDDQPYPKRAAYHRGAGTVTDLAEATDRYTAAAVAARGTDLSIIARTDVFRVTGSLEETVKRCEAYAEAGADALLILDLSPSDLRQIRDDLPPLPVGWIGAVDDGGPHREELRDSGFSIALYPFTTLAVIATSVRKVWSDYQANGVVALEPGTPAEAKKLVIDLVELDRLWTLEDGADAE